MKKSAVTVTNYAAGHASTVPKSLTHKQTPNLNFKSRNTHTHTHTHTSGPKVGKLYIHGEAKNFPLRMLQLLLTCNL